MWAYAIRRLMLSVLMIFIVTSITFFLSFKIPGNPARLIAGPHAKIEQVRAVEREMGLDQPLPVQYATYLGRLLRGDLGESVKTRNPVAEDIRHFFAATFELTSYAMLVTILMGIPLGIISAMQQNRLADHMARLFSLSGVSMPIYWFGLLLQLFLGRIPGVPINGRVAWEVASEYPLHTITGIYTLDALVTGNLHFLGSALLHLVLPTICLAYPALVLVTRMTRATMIEVLLQDYIRTARAIGLSERRVVMVHALRNAMLPITTMLGLTYGTMLGGSFLVEQVFGWPGLGRYAVISAGSSDYPAIMGITILIAVVYNLVNIAVDLSYGLIDPRVRVAQ